MKKMLKDRIIFMQVYYETIKKEITFKYSDYNYSWVIPQKLIFKTKQLLKSTVMRSLRRISRTLMKRKGSEDNKLASKKCMSFVNEKRMEPHYEMTAKNNSVLVARVNER